MRRGGGLEDELSAVVVDRERRPEGDGREAAARRAGTAARPQAFDGLAGVAGGQHLELQIGGRTRIAPVELDAAYERARGKLRGRDKDARAVGVRRVREKTCEEKFRSE